MIVPVSADTCERVALSCEDTDEMLLRREAWTLPRERTDWLEACHSCTVLASTLLT